MNSYKLVSLVLEELTTGEQNVQDQINARMLKRVQDRPGDLWQMSPSDQARIPAAELEKAKNYNNNVDLNRQNQAKEELKAIDQRDQSTSTNQTNGSESSVIGDWMEDKWSDIKKSALKAPIKAVIPDVMKPISNRLIDWGVDKIIPTPSTIKKQATNTPPAQVK